MIILSRRKIEISQIFEPQFRSTSPSDLGNLKILRQILELKLQFRSASPSDLGILPETQYELMAADEVKIMGKFIMPKRLFHHDEYK